MPRPTFLPTTDQRRQVRSMAAYGIKQEDIARSVGLRSPKTLRRHFREELDRASTEANAQVAQTLFKLASSGKSPAATIFWLKARAGWRDGQTFESRPTIVPPFIVAPEKAPQ